MKTMIQLAVAVLFVTMAVLLSGAPRIHAGVVLTGITATSEEDMATKKFVFPKKGQWEKISIYLDSNKFRMDSPEVGVIYRGDLKKIFIISPKEKMYQEFSQDFLRKTRERADQMMKKMQQQFASMPPEQRAMMEQMMKSQKKKSGRPQITFKKGKTGVKVGKWRCAFFIAYKKGKKISENCYARIGELGLKRGDFSGLEAYENIMSTMSESAGETDDNSFSPNKIRKITGFYGFPVKTVDYEEEGKQTRTEVLRIERKRLPSSVFEVPRGYTKSGPGQ